MLIRFLPVVLVVCLIHVLIASSQAQLKDDYSKFDRSNLVAWCIVPFDSQKRDPEQRADMLSELGIKHFAYDYRPEHVPTFESEILALKKHGIELTAWWFPMTLNDEAKATLELFKKHDVHPQLWVMGSGDPKMNTDQEKDFIAAEVERLKPIATAAKEAGCKVALYNHGGWFGDPRNQVKLINAIGADNVGIVFNMHHAHEFVSELAEILKEIEPHLLAINVNGTRTEGDKLGYKILPIGEGDLDLQVIKTINECGFKGRIGILNHTDEDAGKRLQDNLDGLSWVIEQLKGKSPPKPQWRSFSGSPTIDQGLVKTIERDAQTLGDPAAGLKVFASDKTACVSCHRIGDFGGMVGPDLGKLVAERTAAQLITSILLPNREIHPNYQAWQFLTTDGQLMKGYLVSRDDKTINLRDCNSEQQIKIEAEDVEEQKQLPSLMPESLSASLNYQNLVDLVAFVHTLGREKGIAIDVAGELLSHAGKHHIADFPFDKSPLSPQQRPYHTAFINRDRIYDYYAKQADYFRTHALETSLLPEFPGLDGEGFGHWGNQDEAFWADDSWNQVELGNVQSNCFRNGKQTVARAVCIRVGEEGEVAVCYDIDSKQYVAAWSDGFVKYSSVRHGFMDGMSPKGNAIDLPTTHPFSSDSRYRGLFRFGDQIVFHVEDQGKEYLDSLAWQDGKFVRSVETIDKHPLRACLKGGAKRSPESFTTSIRQGTDHPYAIDTIELPTDNPWRVPLFCGDVDFFDDGSCLITTMHGDVWHVDGFQTSDANSAKWHRFASGLYQPLGMKIIEGIPYVLCRDQILSLHDLNGDGVADEYRTFSTAMKTSTAGHDFISGLEQDSKGHFYTASGVEGILQFSLDGKTADVVATGFRNPDGLSVSQDGLITVPCSEGEWTPASMLCAFYPSDKPPFFGYGGPKRGGRPELPLLYLPRGVDNSSGGQCYASDKRWGPLAGQVIHLSYGTGTWMPILIDRVDGQMQGATVLMPGEFQSGAHRAAVSPADGQMYVCGMGGWGTYTPKLGSFERIRYNPSAEDRPMPKGFHLHQNGIAISFSDSFKDPKTIEHLTKAQNHFAQAWDYRYSANYGSAEYSTIHTGIRGHDRLVIRSAQLLDDNRTLFLEIPDLQLCNQLHLAVDVGFDKNLEIMATCHALDVSRTDIQGFKQVAKTIRRHPMEADLKMVDRKKNNPWKQKIAGAKTIVLSASQNLSFDQKELHARAGESIELIFKNPDVVPHNWALIRPNMLNEVGALANRLIADPDAAFNQYIPTSENVICYTDIVEGKESAQIYFQAPKEPGRYPYLCTFPGHWMVMNGTLVVEK